MRVAIVLNPKDNVAVALADLEAGAVVTVEVGTEAKEVLVGQKIPFGHKFALTTIPEGAAIVKYGEVIGRATEAILEGQHVHIHNVEGFAAKARAL